MSLAHEQAEWNHVGLLAVGLVENIFLRIILNTLYFVASHKHVGGIFLHKKSLLHEVVSHATDFTVPLIFSSELFLFSDFKLVGVSIAE